MFDKIMNGNENQITWVDIYDVLAVSSATLYMHDLENKR
jgi:hypothetical protein